MHAAGMGLTPARGKGSSYRRPTNGHPCAVRSTEFPPLILKVKHMLKLLGTIGAVAAAAALYENRKARRQPDLETVAAAELRKILIYAAPPTFLAPVSSVNENGEPLHWLGTAAGN